MHGQLHASGERLETAVQQLAAAERQLEVSLYALPTQADKPSNNSATTILQYSAGVTALPQCSAVTATLKHSVGSWGRIGCLQATDALFKSSMSWIGGP